ncbi:hypothetical protein K503DRAFT_786451 [Rhizopogon vinicolor AM-OR11-026]|uniref:asparaginase n=1 Tax=Rhizopogon vinicolor AM-OR11-026 TaxID=1314800 RepID=A0A1B7MLL4_9AGAM|nr:hypothetical protein K503DRAFT_786451 [Rhizopogon vinicolor AM-OR11-026]
MNGALAHIPSHRRHRELERCPTTNQMVFEDISPHIATLRLFSDITGSTPRAFLAPLTRALKEACDRGVLIVAIPKCAKGTVSGDYETGRTLIHSGVVPDEDTTPEMASEFVDFIEDSDEP